MNNSFVGTCPYCSQQLERITGDLVQCPDLHFAIDEQVFNDIWNSWRPILEINYESGLALLQVLRKENLYKGENENDNE